MTHVTCGLAAKNQDQLRNSMLGTQVWATFTFLLQQHVIYANVHWRFLQMSHLLYLYIMMLCMSACFDFVVFQAKTLREKHLWMKRKVPC